MDSLILQRVDEKLGKVPRLYEGAEECADVVLREIGIVIVAFCLTVADCAGLLFGCQGLVYLDNFLLGASHSPISLNQTSFYPPAERSQGGN
jgi:hypothetical protein